MKARLQADQGHNAAERNVTFRDVLSVMKDHRVWLGGFMYFGLIVPAYGYAYFAPTIVASYGYDPIQTQLRSVPPWAVAFGFSMIVAVGSDWARHRFLFTIGPLILSITGFAILLNVHDRKDVMYGALFLIVMGTYSAMPVIVCWFNMNIGGHHRRSIATAWQVGFGNIGGIIATFSFLSYDAPWYTKGYAISIGFTCLAVVTCIVYAASITWSNTRRANSVPDVGLSEHEKTELGDLNPEFTYLL